MSQEVGPHQGTSRTSGSPLPELGEAHFCCFVHVPPSLGHTAGAARAARDTQQFSLWVLDWPQSSFQFFRKMLGQG